jgi:hypothetical protein
MEEKPIKPTIDLATADGATKLEAYLLCRLAGRVHEFQLMVWAGGLVLLGRARTYYAKQLAQHAVMEATGLPILANKIEVS